MISDIFARHPWLGPLVWQSTLCLAAGLGGSFLLRRHAVRAHQVLLLGLVAAVLIPALSQIVKRNQWGLLVAERAVATPERQPVAAPADFVMPGRPITTAPTNLPPPPEALEAVPASASPQFDWTRAVLPAWLALSSVLLLRLVVQFLRGRRLAKRSQGVEDVQLPHLINAAKDKLGLRADVRVRASIQARSPVIWCWGRHLVLLVPPESRSDTSRNWPSILCHELAHAKRRDHISGLFGELMVCALPWQPLVWWARQRLAALSEEACDDWVIACGQRASGYARTLLGLTPQGQAALLPGVVTNRRGLAGRVRRILEDACANPRPGLCWTLAAVAFAGSVSLGLALAQTRPATRDPETGSTAARTVAPTQEKPANGGAKILRSPPHPNGQPAVFSGRILRGDGGPVAGAKVTLYEALAGKPPFEVRVLAETTSAEDGTCRFSVSAGDVPDRDGPPYGTVVVQKEGLSIGWVSWPDLHLDRQRDVALTEPKDLVGTVVDVQGQPVDSATVFVVGGQYEGRPSQVGPTEYLYTGVARRLLTVTTDATGKFTVRGLPAAGRFELGATKAGYGPAYTWKPERPAEQGLLLVPGRTDLRMVMPPEATIEGKVVEKGSGKPIAGIEIASLCWRTSRLLWPVPVQSAADGAFVMAGLSADAYVLRLAEPRESPADWVAPSVTQEVKAGEVKRDVRIELSKGGLVEVVVTQANEPKPIPGAAVRVQGLSDRTGVYRGVTKADGVARIRLIPGEYRLQDLTKPGYTYSRPEDTFTIEEGQTRRVAWPVRRLPTVSGVTRDEAGRPLPGAAVRVQPMGVDVVLSDAQGRFRVAWDTRNWSAQTVNYLVALDRQRNLASVQPVVEDGNEVELTLCPTATIFGRVVDINDHGIPGAEISVMLWGPIWGSRLFRNDIIKTDVQGRFEIRTIPPKQKYHITAMADGYGRTDIEVEKNEVIVGRVNVGPLHLAVADRAVSGVVVDPQGRPVPNAGVYTVAGIHTRQRDLRTRTDAEGKFRLEGLCAGPVHLQASAQIEGKAVYGHVNAEGGATDVRIVLDKKD